MSMSLREQLLRAGLVTEKQAKEAERAQQQQTRQRLPKSQRGQPSKQALELQRAQAQKAERDRELNRRQQEKIDRKARWLEIKQIVEQHRLQRPESEEYYSFVDGNRVRRIMINAELRARLSRGEIAIVRHDGRYELVPESAAVGIRERDSRAVMRTTETAQNPPVDEAYKEFAVPDDLMW